MAFSFHIRRRKVETYSCSCRPHRSNETDSVYSLSAPASSFRIRWRKVDTSLSFCRPYMSKEACFLSGTSLPCEAFSFRIRSSKEDTCIVDNSRTSASCTACTSAWKLSRHCVEEASYTRCRHSNLTSGCEPPRMNILSTPACSPYSSACVE